MTSACYTNPFIYCLLFSCVLKFPSASVAHNILYPLTNTQIWQTFAVYTRTKTCTIQICHFLLEKMRTFIGNSMTGCTIFSNNWPPSSPSTAKRSISFDNHKILLIGTMVLYFVLAAEWGKEKKLTHPLFAAPFFWYFFYVSSRKSIEIRLKGKREGPAWIERREKKKCPFSISLPDRFRIVFEFVLVFPPNYTRDADRISFFSKSGPNKYWIFR